jgi:hypothetical protein
MSAIGCDFNRSNPFGSLRLPKQTFAISAFFIILLILAATREHGSVILLPLSSHSDVLMSSKATTAACPVTRADMCLS